MDDIFTQVHEVELEIMDLVHKICQKYDIRYSLFYGTLLGAVRHGGFIPWDDDIDIAMPRAEFDRFIEIWNQEQPQGYILQRYETEEDYISTHAKIRKDHTAFIENEGEKQRKFHKGLFIDIFPLDHVAPSYLGQKCQFIAGMLNLLYSRGYKSGRKGLFNIVETVLLATNKKNYKKRFLKTAKMIRHWNDHEETDFLSPVALNDLYRHYPSTFFDDLQMVPFEDRHYYVTKEYDQVLTIRYGNYLELPPVEERVWTHHPLIVDFEHNYEDIQEN